MEAMGSPVLCTSHTSLGNGKSEVIRQSAGYHPSVWGDHFISYIPDKMTSNPWIKERVEVLKEEVKKLLIDAAEKPFEQMNLIDTLQRLCLSYHFEKEIEAALLSMYNTHINHNNDGDDDLYTVALRFRLLRQGGYNVSSDVFTKLKGDDGNFKGVLTNDTKGMLCLYEASHLSVQGEDILDEALDFTSTHLKTMMTTHPKSPLDTQVNHALDLPLHKSLPRLQTKHYMSVYEKDETHNDLILELAKLDFNLIQSLHQRELGDLTRWWKDLNFASKLPFARDRLVECYFWIMGVYFEPQYSLGRRFMTKMISMFSVIDDIYDVYGTMEELQLFTDAIERWDVAAADKLPEYMKVCFLALLNVIDQEIEEEMTKKGKAYRLYYAKESVKVLVRAYFAEAKWCSAKYVPTFEEYLGVSLMSCGYPTLVIQSFVGMGEVATREAFDCVISFPEFIRSAALICRLVDDIQTGKFEQMRGHVASSVQCYMREHRVSEEQACEELRNLVTIAWKDINKQFLKPNSFPLPLLMRVLNLSRVIEALYKYGDEYTNSTGRTKDRIASLLIESIQI